ncbi:MAG: PilX N-terminal domain-containing pilus assembly protein [Planctomycetota bacterium]
MKHVKKIVYRKHRGAVLIISMIFIVIFSALGVSMATLSGSNAQLASNHQQVNRALSASESGLNVVRYYLSNVTISGSVPPSYRLQTVAAALQSNLADAGITNIVANYDPATATLTISEVTLSSQTSQSFGAVISQTDSNSLQVDITGSGRRFSRTIRTNFDFSSSASGIFDFGVATKGPLSLTGNAKIQGLNSTDEANVYIESPSELLALSMIGNSQIAGDVSVVNSTAFATVAGNSSIGGETGQDAIDNDSVELPTPDTSTFASYATNIVDASTDTHGNLTFENIRIVAGANPTFSGNITINGVIFIESPNTVAFTGNTTITGLIVADGDLDSPISSDQIQFGGNLTSHSVSQLPGDPVFDGLRDQTGTFILAPGFGCSFTGNFNTVNGAIAASGVSFTGNANGTITNSVINYSQEPMSLTGNVRLYFDRSDSVDNPSGFSSNQVLEFLPSSYSELPP